MIDRTMPGSPRVERSANIRIQHPNLSTEDAMKLAGYAEDEAKDPKRQSNVRQKTHRLTKGRKRQPAFDFTSNQERKRQPDDTIGRPWQDHGHHGDYLPLSIDFDPMQVQPFENVESVADPHARFQTPPLPSPGPGRPPSELHRTPGCARVEKAARFWLDNPHLSIEDAMHLAGSSDEEVKDKYRQSDIRQTARQMRAQIAAKTNKVASNNNMPSELQGQLTSIDQKLTAIEQKIHETANRLERTVDIKFQELGARLDDKLNTVIRMMGGNPSSTTNYGYQGGSQQQQQQQQQQHQHQHQHQQQQHQHIYQHGGSYPHARQPTQGYNITPDLQIMKQEAGGSTSYPHQ